MANDSKGSGMLGNLARTALEAAREARNLVRGGEPRMPATGDTRFSPPIPPEKDGEEESLDGWGFRDTRFVARDNGEVELTGRRYNICGEQLPSLLPFMAEHLASPLAPTNRHESQYPPSVPESKADAEFLSELVELLGGENVTSEALVRLRHGHGHTGEEIWSVRYGKLDRIPDVVVYPRSHDDVVKLVELAKKKDLCLIPFGGGTNVTDALRCSIAESRIIISVDMRRMNRILWIDPVNRMALIEAGATGRHIQRELEKFGVTMGHEPDSVEFSTLGGWVATNASGMKKNRYGNIEELVLDLQVVSAQGVVSRPQLAPRESVGTNPKNWMFGSEGNYGIITQAVVKLFPLPEVRKYGSVLFPSLEAGFAFLYELQQSGAVPASVRLMDNTQFHFGQALKPASTGLAKGKSQLEKLFVTQVKGFDPNKLAVATLVFEGTKAEVEYQETILNEIADRHGGLQGGAANGERGYQLTYGIAYIRDFAFDHWTIAESFETSVPWSRALELYNRVRERVQREFERRRLPGKPFFSGRITQLYTTGVCIYFYMGFYAKGVAEPSKTYLELEQAAREEILAAGGSLSHHHGVGKLRQHFMKDIYSQGALTWAKEVKSAVDPENVFGAGNHGVLGLIETHAQTPRKSSDRNPRIRIAGT